MKKILQLLTLTTLLATSLSAAPVHDAGQRQCFLDDNSIIRLDAEPGSRTLNSHWSADGRFLAVVTDHAVNIWQLVVTPDTHTSQKHLMVEYRHPGLSFLAWLPDNKTCAVGAPAGTVTLINAETGALQEDMFPGSTAVDAITFVSHEGESDEDRGNVQKAILFRALTIEVWQRRDNASWSKESATDCSGPLGFIYSDFHGTVTKILLRYAKFVRGVDDEKMHLVILLRVEFLPDMGWNIEADSVSVTLEFDLQKKTVSRKENSLATFRPDSPFYAPQRSEESPEFLYVVPGVLVISGKVHHQAVIWNAITNKYTKYELPGVPKLHFWGSDERPYVLCWMSDSYSPVAYLSVYDLYAQKIVGRLTGTLNFLAGSRAHHSYAPSVHTLALTRATDVRVVSLHDLFKPSFTDLLLRGIQGPPASAKSRT